MFVLSTFWKPGVWFLLNLIFLFIVCASLIKLMGYLASQALGMIILQVKMNRKVSLQQLNLYLQDKQIDVQDTMLYAESKTMKIVWQEDDEKLWNKSPPQIEMIYDMKFGYILTVFFTVRERERERERERKFPLPMTGNATVSTNTSTTKCYFSGAHPSSSPPF
jgi:hypothetical protein